MIGIRKYEILKWDFPCYLVKDCDRYRMDLEDNKISCFDCGYYNNMVAIGTY